MKRPNGQKVSTKLSVGQLKTAKGGGGHTTTGRT